MIRLTIRFKVIFRGIIPFAHTSSKKKYINSFTHVNLHIKETKSSFLFIYLFIYIIILIKGKEKSKHNACH